ncbi:MAG: hypothetical protein ACTS9Y_00240 [Methylophilus sp.]|uniref:hypothetical protein n=1 Tax=Methylophilus sp. TaxID=29541 RepID=UPI003F9F87FA
MFVDGFVAKKITAVLEAQELDIQVAVNAIVKNGEVDLNQSHVDEWVGFTVAGQDFDANFFVKNYERGCLVHPVFHGETVNNVHITASVLLH